MIFSIVSAALLGIVAPPFATGPAIADYGPVAVIEPDMTVPDGTVLRVAFDVAATSDDDTTSRHIEKVARFINMHGEGGQEPAPMDLVMVVHGVASLDLIRSTQDRTNVNEPLVEALLRAGVRIVLCGQSAAHHGIGTDQLIGGVETATSAMTAHAVLQADGYAVMPF